MWQGSRHLLKGTTQQDVDQSYSFQRQVQSQAGEPGSAYLLPASLHSSVSFHLIQSTNIVKHWLCKKGVSGRKRDLLKEHSLSSLQLHVGKTRSLCALFSLNRVGNSKLCDLGTAETLQSHDCLSRDRGHDLASPPVPEPDSFCLTHSKPNC